MSLFTEQVQPKGTLKIEVFDKDGQLKDSREITNLAVSTGKNFVASRMVGTAKNPMSHMAIGSGTTAPDVGNTTLLTELGRVAITSATLNNNSVTYSDCAIYDYEAVFKPIKKRHSLPRKSL